MDAREPVRELGAINAIKVGADEMVQLLAAVERLPVSARYEDAGALVRHLFPFDATKQRAVLLRCHALVETIDRECSWLSQSCEDRETVYIEPAMSAAAAGCTLVIRDGSLRFERDEFLQYTLAAAKPMGHA